MTNTLLFIYGILMMVGGAIGYVKAQSMQSLTMGIVSGLVVLAGLWATKFNAVYGYGLITLMAGLLCFIFTKRLLATHAFMPAGMLLILSLIAFVISMQRIIKGV